MIQFPPVPPGERMVISASTFVSYERCPESANARFRQEYGPPTRPSFVGGLAHRVFARHLTTGGIAEEDFAQVCREEIGSAPTLNLRMGELGLKPRDITGIVAEARALYDRFIRFPVEGFRGAEVALEVEPQPDVVLRGRVDAVFDEQGAVKLVDWKTGQVGDPGDQLAFYALLWDLERDEMPVAVEAVSVKTGERHRTEPNVALLEGIAGRIAEMVRTFRTGWTSAAEFERVGGPWCTYCPLLDGCPEGRAAAGVMAQG